MKQTASASRPSDRRTTRRIGAPSGPRKADQRRATLIEAAGKLFVEKGYEATTMDEIAANPRARSARLRVAERI